MQDGTKRATSRDLGIELGTSRYPGYLARHYLAAVVGVEGEDEDIPRRDVAVQDVLESAHPASVPGSQAR
eukprot:3326009-Rhodomonas_salina.1